MIITKREHSSAAAAALLACRLDGWWDYTPLRVDQRRGRCRQWIPSYTDARMFYYEDDLLLSTDPEIARGVAPRLQFTLREQDDDLTTPQPFYRCERAAT